MSSTGGILLIQMFIKEQKPCHGSLSNSSNLSLMV